MKKCFSGLSRCNTRNPDLLRQIRLSGGFIIWIAISSRLFGIADHIASNNSFVWLSVHFLTSSQQLPMVHRLCNSIPTNIRQLSHFAETWYKNGPEPRFYQFVYHFPTKFSEIGCFYCWLWVGYFNYYSVTCVDSY